MRPTTESVTGEVRRVRETLDASVPALVHPEWAALLPWVVQGTTTRGTGLAPFDLGLFSDGSPADAVRLNWDHLLGATDMRAAMHARQVHGADVRRHGFGSSASGARPAGDAPAASRVTGLRIVDDCDGHTTSEPGLLLAVTAADCVPIFVVEAARRQVAVLHAGWRGVAAGMLERGLEAITGDDPPDELYVHLGPAICGACYEVGPEVFESLGLPRPSRPTPLDLRGELARRALEAGLRPSRITISQHCTRCTRSGLFSYRGGDRGRQVGYLGIRL